MACLSSLLALLSKKDLKFQVLQLPQMERPVTKIAFVSSRRKKNHKQMSLVPLNVVRVTLPDASQIKTKPDSITSVVNDFVEFSLVIRSKLVWDGAVI